MNQRWRTEVYHRDLRIIMATWNDLNNRIEDNTIIYWPYVIQFCNESSFQKRGLSLYDDNYVTFHELGVFDDPSESAMPEQCRQL